MQKEYKAYAHMASFEVLCSSSIPISSIRCRKIATKKRRVDFWQTVVQVVQHGQSLLAFFRICWLSLRDALLRQFAAIAIYFSKQWPFPDGRAKIQCNSFISLLFFIHHFSETSLQLLMKFLWFKFRVIQASRVFCVCGHGLLLTHFHQSLYVHNEKYLMKITKMQNNIYIYILYIYDWWMRNLNYFINVMKNTLRSPKATWLQAVEQLSSRLNRLEEEKNLLEREMAENEQNGNVILNVVSALNSALHDKVHSFVVCEWVKPWKGSQWLVKEWYLSLVTRGYLVSREKIYI